MIILLIATLTVDFLDNQVRVDLPPANELAEDELWNKIWSGDVKAIPAERIIREQSYTVQDGFQISSSVPEFEDSPYIILERKDENDGLVEETIFQPSILVGSYDLSNRVEYLLPEWEHNQMTIFKQPFIKLKLNSYEDAYLLSQFTSAPRRNIGGFRTSASRDLTIYLRVPKDLDLNVDENVFVDYINER